MSNSILYINNIDKCIDELFDTLYKKISDDDKFKTNMINIEYILKNFDKINKFIDKIINDGLNKYKIKELLDKEYSYIYDVIKNYMYLYILLNLSFYYKLDEILIFLNNLNKNYVLNFTDNKYIIKYHSYFNDIKKYEYILNNLNNIDNLNLDDFEIYINQIKYIGIDYFENINKFENIHNILKIVIYISIYITEDKNIILKILENIEMNDIEYKYIDIVDTKYNIIDYAVIESMFHTYRNKKYIKAFQNLKF